MKTILLLYAGIAVLLLLFSIHGALAEEEHKYSVPFTILGLVVGAFLWPLWVIESIIKVGQ